MADKQSLVVDLAKEESLIQINPNVQRVSHAKATWRGIQVGHYRQIATFNTPRLFRRIQTGMPQNVCEWFWIPRH